MELEDLPPHLIANDNVSDSGDISVQVLSELLLPYHAELVNLQHERLQNIRQHLHNEQCFIVHRGQHWFTLRRFNQTWILLNSLYDGPLVIPDISAYIHHLQLTGSYIFALNGILEEIDYTDADLQYPAVQIPLTRPSSSFIQPGWISDLPSNITYSLQRQDGTFILDTDIQKSSIWVGYSAGYEVKGDTSISNDHALLVYGNGPEGVSWYIYDISRHGTSVNGTKIQSKSYQKLKTDDRITLGSKVLRIFE
jgi:hypothetical protein